MKMQNYQQRTMAQPQQTMLANNAPNSSIATMGPDTFQNSPFTQSGYNMGSSNQQMNQQQQEQNYLQNVRQQLGNQFNQQMPIQQQPMQQMSQYQPIRNQSNSLASMDPSTYQNFQAFQQQHRNFMPQPQQTMLAGNAPNSSIATMGPDTFQNSPFTQGGYSMGSPNQQMNQQQQEQNYLQNVQQQLGNQFGQQISNQQPMQQLSQYQPLMNQNNSLASMDPSTYQNFQAFQQQHRNNLMTQPQQQTMLTGNAPNSSIATMGPDTFQNSPFTQGGYSMGSPNQQMNQQQQEQNYLQNVQQQLGNQFAQQMPNRRMQ